MLAAATAIVFLLLVVLALLIKACATHPDKRRTAILLAVEALEDRVVPALTLSAVKARIAAEFPAVADRTTPDVVRVGLLRTWAFQEADHGAGTSRLDKGSDGSFYRRSVPQMVQLFDRDAGSVSAAGDAYFLMKLYEAYGYRSGRLAVGFPFTGYDTVTLVRVGTGHGHHKTLIEDATTDRTAVDVHGNPLAAQRVAKLARLGRADEVYWQQGENSGRDFLFSAHSRDAALADEVWGFDPATDSHDAVEIRPNVWKMHGSARGERMESLWWQNTVAPYIDSRLPGAPLVFASSFAFPVWVKGSAGRSFARTLPLGGTQTMRVDNVDELKARIAAEFPGLSNSKTPDAVRAGMLRTWAFEQVDYGDGTLFLDTRLDIDYYNRNIVDLFHLFNEDTGTVLCTGTSTFLMKLYEAYGYIAGTLTVGFNSSGNHTVTLVQVREANGHTNTLIEDAYTDLTPVDVKGRPIGAKQVAKLAREGRGDRVQWQGGNGTVHDLLMSAHGRDKFLRGASWSFDPATDSHDVEKVRPGVYKLRAGPHGPRMITKWWNDAVAPSIRKYHPGWPRVLASTFAFPMLVRGTAGEIFATVFPPATCNCGRGEKR